MLLSREKRLEVLLVESYRGMRLFQPVPREVTERERTIQESGSGRYIQPQHAPVRSGAVRELSLK